MNGEPLGEPGSVRRVDRLAASPRKPDEAAGDVVECGRTRRHELPHRLVVGLYVLSGAASLAWAVVTLIDAEHATFAAPSPTPAIARGVRDGSPLPHVATACRDRDRGRGHRVCTDLGRRVLPNATGPHSLTVAGVSVSYSLPSTPGRGNGYGWNHYRHFISQAPHQPLAPEALIYWAAFPGGGWADRCVPLLDVPAGASTSDLAAAVSTTPGTALVTGPSDVAVGGLAATKTVLTVRVDVGCDPGYLYTWRSTLGGAFWQTTDAGDTITVWIVAVHGQKLLIVGETKHGSHPTIQLELQHIVESIQFDSRPDRHVRLSVPRLHT